ISSEKLKAFHEFNYTPKNTRVVVCGNFDSGEIKKLIEEHFGSWQSAYGEVNGVELEMPKIKKKESYFINRSGTTQCAIRWSKIGPAMSDKDMLSCRIANMLFNQLLFKEIREKGGKTYSIGSMLETSKFSNIISIGCSVRSEVLLSTLELFDKTISNFSLCNFTKEDFDNEINKQRVSLMSDEYPEEVANYYNPVTFDFNKRKNTLAELNNITMQDVKKMIKKYYTPEIYKLVIAGDESLISPQLAKIPDLKKLKATDLEYKAGE
ncbi:MAG: insulinase family protein, partial [Bacteroidia bacterium]|nr:insulinase family protein [Bacteroidia bacterium]